VQIGESSSAEIARKQSKAKRQAQKDSNDTDSTQSEPTTPLGDRYIPQRLHGNNEAIF